MTCIFYTLQSRENLNNRAGKQIVHIIKYTNIILLGLNVTLNFNCRGPLYMTKVSTRLLIHDGCPSLSFKKQTKIKSDTNKVHTV